MTNARIVPFKTGDAVTKIVLYEITRWTAGGSPVIEVSYDSFVVEGGATTSVSWGSQYDTATGSFLTKMPTGIVIRQSMDGDGRHNFCPSQESKRDSIGWCHEQGNSDLSMLRSLRCRHPNFSYIVAEIGLH